MSSSRMPYLFTILMGSLDPFPCLSEDEPPPEFDPRPEFRPDEAEVLEAYYDTQLLRFYLNLPQDAISAVCHQFGLLDTDLHLYQLSH